jgi:hypothetical protein
MAKKRAKDKECDHRELTPSAVFYDDWLEETWLYQICEQCGNGFLVSGTLVKIV